MQTNHDELSAQPPTSSSIATVLRPIAAAEYVCLAQSTLAKGRLYGWGPRFIKLGARSVGYRKADLDAWLEERARNSTSETA